MKKCFTHGGTLAVLAILMLCGVVPDAAAQAPPPLCNPGPGEFEKTWILADDPDGTGTVTPGDLIEFEILLCNSSGSDCLPVIRDGLDDLTSDPSRWDQEPMMGTTGCPTDGGAICEYGPRGGPYSPAPTIICGEDCGASAPDALGFRVAPNMPADFLPNNQCARFRFAARIDSGITTSECLCNHGNQIIDLMLGTEVQTNDPNWVSLEDPTPPVAPGCLDTETCPFPGTQCDTCVRVGADVELGSSTKCIDMTSPTCGDMLTKAAGDPISYEFTVENGGAVPATNVLLTDTLDFLSTLGTDCLDTASFSVTLGPECSWASPCPPGPPAYTCDYNVASSTLQGTFPSIPPGENVTCTITGMVAAGVAGDCTNSWQLQYGGVPTLVPTTPRTFTTDSTASFVNSTKCIDEGATCETTAVRNASDMVDYVVTFVNDGTVQADDVQISDNLLNLGCSGGVVGMDPAVCIPDPTTCPGVTCMVVSEPSSGQVLATVNTIPPGCEIELSFSAVVQSGNTSDCCNVATADWTGPVAGSFTTPDACFSPSGLDLTIDKTVMPTSATPGDPATFTIQIVNNDAANPVTFDLEDVFDVDGCFEAVPNCDTFICTPMTACTGACTPTAGGWQWDGISLAANGNPGDTVTIDFVVNTDAATTEPDCTNAAQVAGGPTCNLGDPGATCHATIDFTGVVEPEVTKQGQGVAPPSSTGTYEVVIDNPTGADLTNCVLRDDLGSTGGCASLINNSCAGAGVTFAQCRNDNVVTDPFSVPAGMSVTVTFDVDTGPNEGPCTNTVTVDCDGFSSGDTAGDLIISSSTGCDLLEMDATHAPITPDPGTVFVASCAVGSTPRLDPADPSVSSILTPAATGDTFGSTAPVNGEIQFYQLDCPCAEGIYLTPLDTGDIEVTFF